MMKNTKMMTLVAAGVAGLALANMPVHAAEKTITLGSTGVSYPTSYKENDKLVGFDVEVANKAFAAEGYKVKWVNGDFDSLLQQLSSKKIQGVSNAVAYNKDRAKQYRFSKLYATYNQQVAVPKDSKAKKVSDLAGKTVGAVQGSTSIKNLNAYNKKVDVRAFESRDDAVTAANTGKVDGVTNSGPILKAVIKDKQLALKMLPDKIAADHDGAVFTKDASGKKDAKIFNAGLKKLYKDGELQKLSHKYFGEDIINGKALK